MREVRTIVTAMDPIRIDGRCEVMLRVWFAEFDDWVPFSASPIDPEPHGRELWIRAMAGEYGPVEVRPELLRVSHES